MFTDIHHHLVHGVDDGPRTFEETQQMILTAHQNNISHLIATAHIAPGISPFPFEAYYKHLTMAQQWCQQNNIPLSIYPGTEILYTDSTARLLMEGQVPTLAETKNVLLEFSPKATYNTIYQAAMVLGGAGYKVIIAHAERYETLRSLKKLRKLREEQHVAIQINARGILEHRFNSFNRWLNKAVKEEQIDIVASDAHNVRNRKCNLQEAYEELLSRFGEQVALKLCVENPREVLRIPLSQLKLPT